MRLVPLMRAPVMRAALAVLLASCTTEPGNGLQQGNGNVWGGNGQPSDPNGVDDIDGDGNGGTHTPGQPNQPGDPNQPGQGPGIPCEVREALEARCWTCHGVTPEGAPMSLATYENFQAPSVSDPDRPVHALALERIHDTDDPMPPRQREQLSAEQKAALDAWLRQGAPRYTGTCTGDVIGGDDDPGDDDPPGNGGGDGDGDAAPVDKECEVIFEARAHGGQTPNDTTPYRVAPGEHYECFYFTIPWDTKHQALDVEPIIDNGKVLHHWLLYQEEGTGEGNGTHSNCVGLHPNQTLLSGWAPGNKGPPLPEDVGLYTPTGPRARFNLEIHYNNSGRVTEEDRSGARVCATSKLRPKEAAQHWLGTEVIRLGPGRGTAGSTCRPTQTAHIISVSPHMHKLGVHMTTEIRRANGTTEMLNDLPFAFDDQQIYGVKGGEVVVGPGDELITTCTYDNNTGRTVTFGPSTDQEMCYNFVTAWPVGSLGTGRPPLLDLLSVSANSQTCMR